MYTQINLKSTQYLSDKAINHRVSEFKILVKIGGYREISGNRIWIPGRKHLENIQRKPIA